MALLSQYLQNTFPEREGQIETIKNADKDQVLMIHQAHFAVPLKGKGEWKCVLCRTANEHRDIILRLPFNATITRIAAEHEKPIIKIVHRYMD